MGWRLAGKLTQRAGARAGGECNVPHARRYYSPAFPNPDSNPLNGWYSVRMGKGRGAAQHCSGMQRARRALCRSGPCVPMFPMIPIPMIPIPMFRHAGKLKFIMLDSEAPSHAGSPMNV
jgi:hypothetical protein